MTEKASIAAAKTELESYLVAIRDSESIFRRLGVLWSRQGATPTSAFTVEQRWGSRLEDVKDSDGNPTGKKHRVPALVPCPISVQHQHNPHKAEELVAEIDCLAYEYHQKIEESRGIATRIETRILALSPTHSEVLYMRYIEGLRLDQIVRRKNWSYSYRQIIRKVGEATEEYARIYGFIKLD